MRELPLTCGRRGTAGHGKGGRGRRKCFSDGPNTPPPISPAKARANSGRSLTPKPPSPTSMLIDEHEKVVAEAIQRAEEMLAAR